MDRLRLAFGDHYPRFDPEGCALVTALRTRFPVACVPVDDNPDALVYGDFGDSHWTFSGRKVYLTG